MVVSGIDRLFLSVASLDKALDYFVGMIGLKVVAEGPLDKALLHQLWKLPGKTTGKSVCLRNAKQSTALEIVELNPVPEKIARDRANIWDYGYYDVAFGVADADKAAKDINKLGFDFYGGPLKYHISKPGSQDIDVIEGLAYGPSKAIVAILEFLTPPLPDSFRLEGNYWCMFDMAQVVESPEEGTLFYQDILGLPKITDVNLTPDVAENLLHIPKDAKIRLMGFNHPKASGPQVELLVLSKKGKELNASPETQGIFMISFESSDLTGELNALNRKGFKTLSGPVQVNTVLHGKVLAADVEGPSKLRVELFQKI